MGLEGAVKGAKRFLKGAALASSIYLSGCIVKEVPVGLEEEDPQIETSYINFHAYWAEQGEPSAVVNVYLYEANSDKRLIAGGTNPNGNFYSLSRFPINELYQIFIQDIGTRNCLDNVLVSFSSNNPWPKSARNNADKRINIGPRNPTRNLTGCMF